ncbi:phosphotransferase [Virgibacillus pantothenticus]|uniref:phosphotransferase n=1 Tax=Virgibacillus pantothenticus TaxID=1473 RepID=UPI00147D3EFF|nr:phosphotransferase [Virgibacillus pantothenticus]
MLNEQASWNKSDDNSSDDQLILSFIEQGYQIEVESILHKLGRWGESVRWLINGKTNKFLLKEKPYYLDEEDFAFQRKLQEFLYQKGGPVARIVRTGNDKLEAKTPSGRTFELQYWIEGQRLSPSNKNDLIDIGSSIALFAILTRGFNSSRNNWELPKCRPIHFPINKSDFIKKMELIKDSLTELNINNLEHYAATLRWVESAYANINWGFLPESYIHGDAHLFNAVRDEYNKVILVDLDDSRWDYRITDLVWCCSISSCIQWDIEYSEPRINSDINLKNIHYLLVGYNKVTELTEEELNSFPNLLGLNLIMSFILCLGLDEGKIPFDVHEQLITLNEILNKIENLDVKNIEHLLTTVK